MSNTDQVVKAVVQKVIPNGKHGPYVVSTADGIKGSITFSLKKDVWNENEWPESGEFVLLSKFHQKRSGWRAMSARFLRPDDEQIANRKEQVMKGITALLERWKARLFPTRDDKVWREWVDFKKQDWNELVKFVANKEIDDSFKARALFILLTPNISLCPFYWVDHDGIISRNHGYFRLGQSSINLNDLSPTLVDYVADLTIEFYKSLKERKSEKTINTMESYNNLIIDLLTKLPYEKAKEVFKLFEINDLSSWWNEDEFSGYNPLARLFSKVDVPERWKVEADRQMREVILKELAGITKPREEHENSLKCYANLIESQLRYKKLKYSKKLFVNQIKFIVEATPEKWPSRSISPWSVAKIFKIMAAENNEENKILLRKFCHFVLTPREEFFVFDKGTMEAAQLMSKILKKGPDAKQLQDIITAGKKRLSEQNKNIQSSASTEQSIINKMKRPIA